MVTDLLVQLRVRTTPEDDNVANHVAGKKQSRKRLSTSKSKRSPGAGVGLWGLSGTRSGWWIALLLRRTAVSDEHVCL